MDVRPGSTVVVKAYPNEQLERLVFEVQTPTVFLTTEEEWRIAKMESRQPVCVGFPMRDIVRIKE